MQTVIGVGLLATTALALWYGHAYPTPGLLTTAGAGWFGALFRLSTPRNTSTSPTSNVTLPLPPYLGWIYEANNPLERSHCSDYIRLIWEIAKSKPCGAYRRKCKNGLSEEVAERLRTRIGPYDVDHPQTVLEPLDEVTRLLELVLSPQDGAPPKEDMETLKLLRDLFEVYIGYSELVNNHYPDHKIETFQHYLNGFRGSKRATPYRNNWFVKLRSRFVPTETETWSFVGLQVLGVIPAFIIIVMWIVGPLKNPGAGLVLGMLSAYVSDLTSHKRQLDKARHDSLTGLPTGHYLDMNHGREDELNPHGRLMVPLRMALRGQEDLSLASVDTDSFNALNGKYGTAGADRILKVVLQYPGGCKGS